MTGKPDTQPCQDFYRAVSISKVPTSSRPFSSHPLLPVEAKRYFSFASTTKLVYLASPALPAPFMVAPLTPCAPPTAPFAGLDKLATDDELPILGTIVKFLFSRSHRRTVSFDETRRWRLSRIACKAVMRPLDFGR